MYIPFFMNYALSSVVIWPHANLLLELGSSKALMCIMDTQLHGFSYIKAYWALDGSPLGSFVVHSHDSVADVRGRIADSMGRSDSTLALVVEGQRLLPSEGAFDGSPNLYTGCRVQIVIERHPRACVNCQRNQEQRRVFRVGAYKCCGLSVCTDCRS